MVKKTEDMKEYMHSYYQTNKAYIARIRRNPMDRMQVQAFKSIFNDLLSDDRYSCEEAFLEALDLTDDDHMMEAIENRPGLINKWLDGDFEKVDKRERDMKRWMLQHDRSLTTKCKVAL